MIRPPAARLSVVVQHQSSRTWTDPVRNSGCSGTDGIRVEPDHEAILAVRDTRLVGIEVERTEDIFEQLIDLDVLDEVRIRYEVALTTTGRTIVSESPSDQ